MATRRQPRGVTASIKIAEVRLHTAVLSLLVRESVTSHPEPTAIPMTSDSRFTHFASASNNRQQTLPGPARGPATRCRRQRPTFDIYPHYMLDTLSEAPFAMSGTSS